MSRRSLVLVMLGAAVVTAALLSHLASDALDGLERVAHDQGFAGRAQPQPGGISWLSDYQVPGLEGSFSGRAIAGLAGTLVTLGLTLLLGRLLQRRRAPPGAG